MLRDFGVSHSSYPIAFYIIHSVWMYINADTVAQTPAGWVVSPFESFGFCSCMGDFDSTSLSILVPAKQRLPYTMPLLLSLPKWVGNDKKRRKNFKVRHYIRMAFLDIRIGRSVRRQGCSAIHAARPRSASTARSTTWASSIEFKGEGQFMNCPYGLPRSVELVGAGDVFPQNAATGGFVHRRDHLL